MGIFSRPTTKANEPKTKAPDPTTKAPEPNIGFSDSVAVKLFFSHKELDRDISKKINGNLKREFGDDIDIFLSSNAKCIPGGVHWQKTIERNLRRADWMFFLYLNPRQVWDWCFYEAGVFLGAQDDEQRHGRLVVLHPEGVPQPAPFANLQTVGADPAKIETSLREMLANSPRGAKKTDEDWQRIAKSIANDIQSAAIQFFDGRYQLTMVCPMIVNSKNSRDVKVDVDHAEVCIIGESQGLLEIGGEKGIPWRDFGEHLNERRGVTQRDWERAFDFYAIKEAAKCVRRDKHLGVAELQSFRVGDAGYRPIITGADMEEDGTVQLTLYLIEIPNSLDPRYTNSFDTVYQSLSLGCQLRREVVERNAMKLAELKDSSDPTEENSEAKTVLANIWRAFESVVDDSLNRGLTPDRTREAFGEDMQSELDDLIDKWTKAYEQFEHATAKVEVQRSKSLFTVMRYLNVRFLKLAEERLRQLLEKVQLPDPSELTESARTLLPKSPAGSKTTGNGELAREATGKDTANNQSAQDLPSKKKLVKTGARKNGSGTAAKPSSNGSNLPKSGGTATKAKAEVARGKPRAKKPAHSKVVRTGKPRKPR